MERNIGSLSKKIWYPVPNPQAILWGFFSSGVIRLVVEKTFPLGEVFFLFPLYSIIVDLADQSINSTYRRIAFWSSKEIKALLRKVIPRPHTKTHEAYTGHEAWRDW